MKINIVPYRSKNKIQATTKYGLRSCQYRVAVSFWQKPKIILEATHSPKMFSRYNQKMLNPKMATRTFYFAANILFPIIKICRQFFVVGVPFALFRYMAQSIEVDTFQTVSANGSGFIYVLVLALGIFIGSIITV